MGATEPGNIALGGDGLFLKADGLPDAHTKLLIHSDTHDGSTTFTDASPSGHTVTKVGDPTHEVEQKKFGASSLYFDGNDSLTVADNDDVNDFGTGDYTIDFWFNSSVTNQRHTSFFSTEGAGGGYTLLLNNANTSDGTIAYWGGLGSDVRTSSGGYNDGNWHHVALVRNGTSLAIYVDGVSKASATSSSSESSSGTLRIGDSYYSNRGLTGYMDEFRISKGIARWTAAFTPPTRAYSYVDLNSNLNVAGYLDAPNIIGKPDSYTKLLLHSDTTDGRGTFTDSSPSGHAITTVSDPTHETDKSKFGASSIYFDGNDRLQIASHADWAFGTGDFTVDCWVNKSATVAWETFLATYESATGGFICGLYAGNSQMAFYSEPTGTWHYEGGTALALNTWYHLAWVRDGNNFRMFVDGVQQGSTITFSSSDNYTERDITRW